MPTIPSNQAANLLNTLLSLANQVVGVANAVNDASDLWTNASIANTLNAFPTAIVNDDGTLGDADTVPTTGHPIDVRVEPGSQIHRSYSAQDAAGLLTGLQGIRDAIQGKAVAANGALVQLLAKAIG